MFDPIADMFTRIRNALKEKKEVVTFPSSSFKLSILKVLLAGGYISSYDTKRDGAKSFIDVFLKYKSDSTSYVSYISRVSRPSKRVYVEVGSIGRVRNGFGDSILSTSQGVMLGRAASKIGLGGELIGEIY